MKKFSSNIGVKLLVLNLIATSLFFINFFTTNSTDSSTSSSGPASTTTRIMSIQDQERWTPRFEDPEAALEVLTQLDVHSVVQNLHKTKYHVQDSRLPSNFNYCNEHRAYFVSHPDMVFKEKYDYVTSFSSGHQLRKDVLKKIGYDKTQKWDKEEKAFIDGLAPDNNMFLHFTLMFYIRQVGTQFACLTQASNHIAGHDRLYRKDMASEALVEYAKGYKSQPECFSYNKYFPKTWVLRFKDQCEDFFKEFNSEYYQQLKQERNVVYFRKIGANVHEGKGVFPVNDDEEKYLRKLYKNGELCGEIDKNFLIQYNVHNLLLVKNRKFGFRSFMLVASTNPLIAFYHDGYARLSLNEYNAKSNEKSTFVTNIGVNIQNPAFAGWSKRQIDEYTCWSMQQFSDYMYETGLVSDPNWLQNHLRKEFMKVKVHLLRMAQDKFFKISQLFEVYGIDYVMDENLNLWFIEANAMPLMQGFTQHTDDLFRNLMMDTYDIVSGLIKSRAKRIIYYVNNLVRKEGTELYDIEDKREEFRRLTMNYFEPEFRPRANSTFYPIVDENLSGTYRYFGLLEEKCLTHN